MDNHPIIQPAAVNAQKTLPNGITQVLVQFQRLPAEELIHVRLCA